MLNKRTLLKTFTGLRYQFFTQFGLTFFLFGTIIYLLDLKITFVNPQLFLTSVFIFGYMGFLNWYLIPKNPVAQKYFSFINYAIFILPMILWASSIHDFSVTEHFLVSFVLICLSISSGWAIIAKSQERILPAFPAERKRNQSKNTIFFCAIFLLLIIFNYVVISSFNLDLLPPQNDEFLTYEAVKYITDQGLKFSELFYGADNNVSPDFYSRALPYSLGVAGTVQVFGGDYLSIFNLRILSVILGIFTLLILYLYLRKELPMIVTLTTVYSFSTFYLFVYHSRVARMYSLAIFVSVTLFYLFIRLYQEAQKLEIFDPKLTLRRLSFLFFEGNWQTILLFTIVFIIGLKTHLNIALLIPPMLLFSALFLKNSHAKIAAGALLFASISILLSAYLGHGPISSGYFSQSLTPNWSYVAKLFEYYKSTAITLIFFLLPLPLFRYLPLTIKFSYITFGTLFAFFFFAVNGVQFHDPRYFIFLFPLYNIGVIFGIFVLSLAFLSRTKRDFISPAVFLISVLFVFYLQIGNACVENKLFTCPISDKNKVFNLDRWNYRYDEGYEVIKSQITPNTVVASRTLHNYYSDKYQISHEQQCKLLTNFSKQDECTWGKIQNKDVILVVYPDLVYTANERSGHDDLYNFLYASPYRLPLYESPDSRIFIYQIKNQSELNY